MGLGTHLAEPEVNLYEWPERERDTRQPETKADSQREGHSCRPWADDELAEAGDYWRSVFHRSFSMYLT